MPPKPDLSFSGLFVNESIVCEPKVKKHVVETSEAKASADKPKVKTVKPSFAKIKFVKSKEHVKSPRKTTVKQDYEEINREYVAFGGNPKEGKITGRATIKIGKDFSGRKTPLFSTMMVQAHEEMGEEHVADKAVNKEMDDNLERAVTTATSLDAEQDRGNIFKTQSKATPNEPGSFGTSSGGGLRCQETMGDIVAQTRVLDLETIKTTQALKIDSLKRRVKKLERRKRSRTHGLKRLYKVGMSARVESSEDEGLGEEDASKQRRIADIDANEDIYLVTIIESVDVAEHAKEVIDDITLAKALIEIKSAKPKADKVVIQEPEAEEELEQENAKKQKMKDDKEYAGLKYYLEIIPDDRDDVTVDATPLSSKSPIIVDYKIHKEGKKIYF
nr:hypothetical protein [Tanacetum cinerariifolium]